MDVWRCVSVEMCMWRFAVIDAAKLCLWLVEVLRYKTKTMSVNVTESCLYLC